MHADVVPAGGAHVTADLSRMLTAPLSAAERLKTLYGAALGDIETGTDVVAVPQMGENGDEYAVRVPRSMLTRIIQPRLEEILGEVQSRLRASGYDVAAGRRAVLTGGACQLAGTRELAQRILNKQVRIGRPRSFTGLAGIVRRSGLCDGVGPSDGRGDHAAGAAQSRSCSSSTAKAAKWFLSSACWRTV